MIILKNKDEIDKMKKAGEVIKKLFEEIDKRSIIKIGTTTKSIDLFIGNYIKDSSAVPSFLNYRGFPANSCISINDTVVHGIPDDYAIVEGDGILRGEESLGKALLRERTADRKRENRE